MKKVLSTMIITTILLSLVQFSAIAASFSDMPEDHWAYSYVSALVNDGTVKGYDDGEFKPNNIVTRAEFVKMIGKGPDMRTQPYIDVPDDHWGYEYIMYSGLEGKKSYFYPDTPITRNDVIELIWKRAGSVVPDLMAPPVVTKQAVNKSAVSWAYMNGLIIGDDGVNLRLDETLTRAEGSAMIVRAREINAATSQVNFIDTISQDILKYAYESIPLFGDKPYNPDGTITNGEMAVAALRIGSEEFTLTYSKYSSTEQIIDHEYGKPLDILTHSCLSTDKNTIEYANKTANVQDTLTAFLASAIRRSNQAPFYGDKDNYYSDIKSVDNDTMNQMLTLAKKVGIQFDSSGRIGAEQPITLRQIAALLVQIDGLVGMQTDYIIGADDSVVKQDNALQLNLSKLESPCDDYQLVLSNVPSEVYRTPFKVSDNSKAEQMPHASYNFAREYQIIYTSMLVNLKGSIKTNHNTTMSITYYPSMVCYNGSNYVMRCRLEIVEPGSANGLGSIFRLADGVDASMPLAAGSVFYADINIGQRVDGIYLPIEKVSIDQIVYTVQ